MIAQNLEKMLDREKLDRIKKILKEKHDNRLKDIIAWFTDMKPFRGTDDIPEVPIVEPEIYQSVIIPNLIRCGAIPKKDLKSRNDLFGLLQKQQQGEVEWHGICI